MEFLSSIKALIPDYAKDIRLNLDGTIARSSLEGNDAVGVALRATFIVDPDNTIQHVSVNNLNVGRNPEEVLRILDGLQTDELCPCNRAVGGATL